MLEMDSPTWLWGQTSGMQPVLVSPKFWNIPRCFILDGFTPMSPGSDSNLRLFQ
jgi:hypothetical protein